MARKTWALAQIIRVVAGSGHRPLPQSHPEPRGSRITPPPSPTSLLLLPLHLDGTRPYCGLQCRVIAFGLVGVGEREFTHRLVEIVPLAEVTADRPGIACLGMRARQNPAAGLGVDRQH